MGCLPESLRPEAKLGQKVDPSRRRALIYSYAPDWALAVVLWAALAALDKIDGFRREFSLTDTSIQHTHALNERVPVWLLVVVAGLAPLVIILFIAVVLRRSFWDAHNGTLGLLLAWSFTSVATQCIKITVGRPRPDLIDRCQPAPNASNASPYGLATSVICTQTDLLMDGFRSFPSGHSSTAFAGLGFLSFFLAGKLHLFDAKGLSLKSWICLTPLLGAALIAISRTMDYRHHATDVLAGSLLGFFVGLWSYLMYYPSLRHPRCHLPYSPRIPAADVDAPDGSRSKDVLPGLAPVASRRPTQEYGHNDDQVHMDNLANETVPREGTRSRSNSDADLLPRFNNPSSSRGRTGTSAR